MVWFFFFQAEDGIRDHCVTGVQTCALPICFGLRRLAMTHVGRVLSIESARQGATRSASRLFDILIRPLQRYLDGRRLVVIPTASLHSLPWPALPMLDRIPLTIAPSATIWRRCMTTSTAPGGSIVLCAGPGLPEAQKEVVDLVAAYPGALGL